MTALRQPNGEPPGTLGRPDLEEILFDRAGPRVSVYQSTHRRHPDNQRAPIRFRNLIGRVAVLLLKIDRHVPVYLEAETGAVRAERLAHPEPDDALDKLAEQVLRRGGEFVIVATGRMPSGSGLAATYRH